LQDAAQKVAGERAWMRCSFTGETQKCGIALKKIVLELLEINIYAYKIFEK